MRRALSKSPRGGEEAAFCVCAWRVGGRQRCSRSGGTFHADFELFGRFSFLSPGVGPASGVGDAPQWRHRAAVPGPELFGMSAPCLTNLQKLCGTKQTPLFTRKGSENAPLLPLLKQPRRCPRSRTGQGPAGTRWHLHSASVKPKTNPGEPRHGLCRGERQTSPKAPLQPCFPRRWTRLCCCTISPLWIFGHFLLLPDTKSVPLRSVGAGRAGRQDGEGDTVQPLPA